MIAKRITITIIADVRGDLMDNDFKELKNQILNGSMQRDMIESGQKGEIKKVIATYKEEIINTTIK